MLTPIQQKILQFIDNYIKEHEFSPSLTEIADGIGISPNSISLISRNIHSLVKASVLKFHKKGYRNLALVNHHPYRLPLKGRIAAGSPIEAIEEQSSLDLSELLKTGDHFLLQVKGDSMVDKGILSGDFVICKPALTAKEGDIVVALIDDEAATLKQISYKIPDRITLIPANPALKPKAYLPQRVKIQGVFVGLLRLRDVPMLRRG